MPISLEDKPLQFEGTDEEKAVLRYSWGCRQEAFTAKRDRMFINRRNYDTYHLKGDFTHKLKGQSKEFLPKMMMATEQVTSFMHQALIDAGQWFRVESESGVVSPKIKPDEVAALLERELNKIRAHEVISDSIKMGLIGSLMIAKVYGEYVQQPEYKVRTEYKDGSAKKSLWKKNKDVWRLKVDLIRQEDWFPDPTGEGLYHMQQIETDIHQLQKLAKGPNAIYDQEVIDRIVGGFEDMEQVARKARETAQNQTYQTLRKRCRVWEFYGTILDPSTGKVLHENVTWTVVNDRYLVRKPTKYEFWHGDHPFVVAPILRVPRSVWHKAMMDAPTALNVAQNELFNLILDNGLMNTWGIRQLHTAWLADETQISEGISPGTTLEVTEACPPGAKVLESVQTSESSPEGLQAYQQLNAEFNQAALTNDLRMGVMPSRQVKATEVVEASQTITSMFSGIAKIVEGSFIDDLLKKAWLTIAQHVNDIDSDEVKAVLGNDRAVAIAAMSNEEVFAETARGLRFKAYGISQTLGKMKDFRKLTSLLQTIGGSEVMIEEFVKKYDFGSLLTEIMRSLDIDTSKIELPQHEQDQMALQRTMQQGAMQPGMNPNTQSNVAQVAGMGESPFPGGGEGGAVPQTKFPPSRATPSQQG